MDKYNLLDLCCGTGAFSYSFHETKKVKTVFSNDICKNSEKIFNLNNTLKLTLKNLNDIKLEKIPNHDILCAGFPCQPFSIAGNRKGFDDERSNIFWSILKIIKKYKPGVVFLENVKNLKTHDKGNTFKIIISNLEELGYFIKYKVLNTCVITDIPQNRERIYIVCFKNKQHFDDFDFDFDTKNNKNIKDLCEDDIDDKYYYNDRFKVWDIIQNGVVKKINDNIVYQYRRYYLRENKNKVCPTLTANMGSGGHNVPLIKDDKGIRKLTPRECFNLQGFPKTFKLPEISDSALYKLAGNAVSIPVIQLIVDKIINVIK